jgi:hypothetical protein
MKPRWRLTIAAAARSRDVGQRLVVFGPENRRPAIRASRALRSATRYTFCNGGHLARADSESERGYQGRNRKIF